jgi:hypothetical protein
MPTDPENVCSWERTGAIYATAAQFSAAENEAEQTSARVVLAALVDSVMARDEKLSNKVKAATFLRDAV